MFWFRDPAEAVVASLEMVERVPDAGLPTAHVGVSAGPIIQQDGDYYGRTVNLAARISARAAPSEVLVTAEVVEKASGGGVRFEDVGPVELKGFASPIALHRAERV
jgi:class 3 adenylate cyclase